MFKQKKEKRNKKLRFEGRIIKENKRIIKRGGEKYEILKYGSWEKLLRKKNK